MIALLDGDIISYRSAASCEPTKIKLEREPLEVAIQRADELVRRILNETNSTSYRLFLGGDSNFRYSIDPKYKANRADKPKPTYLQDVRAFLCREFNAEITDGIEADDALGIEQMKLLHTMPDGWLEGDSVICSIDKDLHMIPGLHYNFVKQEWREIDPDYALAWFYQQLIQGDQSDNIFGYDGKARPKIPQFLQPKIDELWECETEWEMYCLVSRLYMLNHDSEAEAEERLHRNAQLLWIQRKEGDVWVAPKDERLVSINRD